MDAQLGSQSSSLKIADRLFIQQLGHTRSLVTFLIRRQALPEKPPDVLTNLAALGSMRYSPAGRPASEEEWRKLYTISRGLASELPLDSDGFQHLAVTHVLWSISAYLSNNGNRRPRRNLPEGLRGGGQRLVLFYWAGRCIV